MLLLSTRLIKLILSYNSLAEKAHSSEAAACQLLQTPPSDQLDAFRIMYDYHVVGTSGLSIPTWIWTRRKDERNYIWATHRAPPVVKTTGG